MLDVNEAKSVRPWDDTVDSLSYRSAFWVTVGSAAVILILTMPRLIYVGDAISIRDGTVALLRDGDLSVPAAVAERFGERGQYFYYNEEKGAWYSKYGPLNVLLYLLPLLVEWLVAGRLGYFHELTPAGVARQCLILNAYHVILALCVVVYLFQTARRYSRQPWLVCGFTLAVCFGTFTWNYLRAQTVEVFQLLFFTGLYYHLTLCGPSARDVNTRRGLHHAMSLVFLGSLVLQKLVFGVLMPIVALFLLAAYREPGEGTWAALAPRRFVRQVGTAVLTIGLPLVLIAALALAANGYRFGSPFNTGYTQFERERQLLVDPSEGLVGFWVEPRKSVLLHFPLLGFAAIGAVWFARRYPVDWFFALFSFLAIYLASSFFVNWRGNWCYGPRYLLPVLPVLSLPVLALLDPAFGLFRAGRYAMMALMAGILAWSVWNQWWANRLEFFTPFRVEAQFEPVRTPEIAAYFQQPYWVIQRDLVAFKGGGRPFPPLEDTRSRLHAAQPRELERVVRGLTVGNVFWLDLWLRR